MLEQDFFDHYVQVGVIGVEKEGDYEVADESGGEYTLLERLFISFDSRWLLFIDLIIILLYLIYFTALQLKHILIHLLR